MSPKHPIVVVHGGAWNIPRRWRAACAEACRHAAGLAHDIVLGGGHALDAVCAAIRAMEDAPVLDAGIGAAPDMLGGFALDASVMRGVDLACGAVARIPPTRHPIDLARAVMEHSPHVLLAGPDALAWGAQHGIEPCPASALELTAPWSEEPPYLDGGDTVGAVALDRHGVMVAGTSTGGVPGRHPARVGDSPLIGCGTYCDTVAGAGSTGKGEAIIRTTLARAAVDAVRWGAAPMEAARRVVDDMTARTGSHGGIIVVDAEGRPGVWHTTPAMAWGIGDAQGVRAGFEWREGRAGL